MWETVTSGGASGEDGRGCKVCAPVSAARSAPPGMIPRAKVAIVANASAVMIPSPTGVMAMGPI